MMSRRIGPGCEPGPFSFWRSRFGRLLGFCSVEQIPKPARVDPATAPGPDSPAVALMFMRSAGRGVSLRARLLFARRERATTTTQAPPDLSLRPCNDCPAFAACERSGYVCEAFMRWDRGQHWEGTQRTIAAAFAAARPARRVKPKPKPKPARVTSASLFVIGPGVETAAPSAAPEREPLAQDSQIIPALMCLPADA